MKSWPLGAKIGAGVVATVVVFFVYSRVTRESSDVAPVESAALEPQAANSERVQQRLEQLRASHRNKGKGTSGDRIEAHSGMRPAPDQHMGKSKGAAAGGSAKAEVTAPTGDAPPFDEDPDDVPALTNLALHDPDPERRLAAVTMLGSADDPQVIPTLAQALADQDDEVRMAALEALSDFTDEPPVDLIARAADDPSPDIRFEAIDVLSDIGGDRARGTIEKALNDPDEDVRSLAEGILDFEQLYEPTPGEAAPSDSAAPADPGKD